MIRRLSVDLEADATGAFAPVDVTPGPCLLIALETTPGEPALSDWFDVVLRSSDCRDEACGAGLARSGSVAERRVCRVPGAYNMHLTIRARKALQVVVRGNRIPHARLSVALIVATDD